MGIACRKAPWIDYGCQIVVGIVGESGDAAVWISDLAQAIERIKLVGRVPCKGRINRGWVPVAIVSVRRRDRRSSGSIDVLIKLA